MEQMGMTKADMVKYLGSQSRVSEVLNRKRKLTLSMVKSLYKGLRIPAEILLA
jgi:HTH-type transcriptional regulator/antitoxin HigA